MSFPFTLGNIIVDAKMKKLLSKLKEQEKINAAERIKKKLRQ